MYATYWWNEVNFPSARITLDRLHIIIAYHLNNCMMMITICQTGRLYNTRWLNQSFILHCNKWTNLYSKPSATLALHKNDSHTLQVLYFPCLTHCSVGCPAKLNISFICSWMHNCKCHLHILWLTENQSWARGKKNVGCGRRVNWVCVLDGSAFTCHLLTFSRLI